MVLSNYCTTFYLEGGFIPEKEFCSNRLPVSYNPDAPEPAVWLKFLDDLLYPEDKLTLQEFMGYSLTPNTRSQSMFILIGSGGEGKSRIGFVCRNLLGNNMNVCSLNKLSSNRFAPADQEGKLLMIDDDMRMEALSDTGISRISSQRRLRASPSGALKGLRGLLPMASISPSASAQKPIRPS